MVYGFGIDWYTGGDGKVEITAEQVSQFRTINIMPTNYRNTFCVFKSFNGRKRGYAGTHLRYRLQDVTILLILYLFTTFQLSYIVCFSANGTVTR